jgi:hypothetical protein
MIFYSRLSRSKGWIKVKRIDKHHENINSGIILTKIKQYASHVYFAAEVYKIRESG